MGERPFSTIYMRVHACIHVGEYMHACTYILQYPTTPSIEVSFAGFAPLPHPPLDIEKLRLWL